MGTLYFLTLLLRYSEEGGHDSVKGFLKTVRFVKSLNSTFIVLVPKKEGAVYFKDFHPISLVGSLYKLIAKVLPNRLRKVMSCLVSKAQNAFVEGRQILDVCLIANEVIDSMTKRKKRGCYVNWILKRPTIR